MAHEVSEFIRCHRNSIYDEEMVKMRKGSGQCKLVAALLLALAFMTVEIIGGYIAGSLAILSDAAHMASDVLAFAVSAYAAHLAKREPSRKYTYGYHRIESMGALFSIVLLWIVTVLLIQESIQRLIYGEYDVAPFWMLVVSGAGMVFNIILLFVLHGGSNHGHSHGGSGGGHGHSHSGGGHGHSHGPSDNHGHSHGPGGDHNDSHDHGSENSSGITDDSVLLECALDQIDEPLVPSERESNMNMRASVLHVIGDLVQSVGVLVAALVIKFIPGTDIVDPILTLVFAVIVILTTVTTFLEIMKQLMQTVPSTHKLDELEKSILAIKGIDSIHSMHLWSLSSDKNVFSAHILISPDFEDQTARIVEYCQMYLQNKYRLFNITLQPEVTSSNDILPV